MLSPGTTKRVSFAEYGQSLSAMHPAARPLSLTAREYERVPSQKMVYIFLDGQNGSERFFYRLVMEGTANVGYKVSGLFRGSGPYPSSPLRARLQAPHST
jgi:hypothetical protein